MSSCTSSSPTSCVNYLSEYTRKRKRTTSCVDEDIENRSAAHSDDNNGKTRRVNPYRLAERLDPNLVKEMEAFIKPGAMMPNFSVRKELQERYQVDRRHLYDYFHSRGLRVAKEDRHSNLTRSRLAKAQALKATEAEKPSQPSSSFTTKAVKSNARSVQKCSTKPILNTASRTATKSVTSFTRPVLADKSTVSLQPIRGYKNGLLSNDDVPSAHISTVLSTPGYSLPQPLSEKSEDTSLDMSDVISFSSTSPLLDSAVLSPATPEEDIGCFPPRLSSGLPVVGLNTSAVVKDENPIEPFSPSDFVREFFDPLEEWIVFPSEDAPNDSPFPTVADAMSVDERENLYSSISSTIESVGRATDYTNTGTDQVAFSSRNSVAQGPHNANVRATVPCIAEDKVSPDSSAVSHPLVFSPGPQGFTTSSLSGPTSVPERHLGTTCTYLAPSDLSQSTVTRYGSFAVTFPGFSTVLLQSLDPASPVSNNTGYDRSRPGAEHLRILDMSPPYNSSQDPTRLGASEMLNGGTSDVKLGSTRSAHINPSRAMMEKDGQLACIPHDGYSVARPRSFVPQPSRLRTISAGGGI